MQALNYLHLALILDHKFRSLTSISGSCLFPIVSIPLRQLILHAVNPRDVSTMFRDFARSIHRKIPPTDANFTQWSVQLSAVSIREELQVYLEKSSPRPRIY